jgi:phosphoribosylaminoimidazole carboxylase
MNKTLGIVGGGQLGQMLAAAAQKLGFKVIVLDPTPNCPASQYAEQIEGSFKDKEAVFRLAERVDFLTFEIESANADALIELEAQGKSLNPKPSMLSLIKDKYAQKEFYQKHNIACAPSLPVASVEAIKQAAEKFNYPILLKKRFDAYDGRGNALVNNEKDIHAALDKLGLDNLYVEAFVPFVKELSVVVARDVEGHLKHYPVVETVHKNNICHTVICPADIADAIKEKSINLATSLVSHLEGAGVFAVELFLTESGDVLVNETAPRVHNSGHHTIEACKTSQFEQHVRAVTGMPLGDTDLIYPAAIMMNILGNDAGEVDEAAIHYFRDTENCYVHWYGKSDIKPERKMGHITCVGSSLQALKIVCDK